MKIKLPLLMLMMLCISACATNRPLVYEEMTAVEQSDELKLQNNLRTASMKIAELGFKFVDEGDRANIAKSTVKALTIIKDILESGDPSQFVKGLIDDTLKDLKLLGADIGEVAKDAFDLFNGWINLPTINDVLPEVVADRLLAFINGALAGLEPYAAS